MDETDADRYLLQFWPAPPAPDRVVRQTSFRAAYWHREHRHVPMTPAERASDDALRSRERELEDWRRFGDRAPTGRLRAVESWLGEIQAIDADLMWALAKADDDTHRGVARWAARANADSLTAAIDTVVGAALVHGPDDYREFLRDLWRTFPQLHRDTAG